MSDSWCRTMSFTSVFCTIQQGIGVMAARQLNEQSRSVRSLWVQEVNQGTPLCLQLEADC